ncbi:hypothetical protein RI845_18310 [Thalassotalea nanhaiensis]|uniref:Uncharacterized protein n=1 Tax=Thalassotalea nanhaiensis TaxID=3065648 RepID=A0ABY9THZ2_9GAMM|nr:hypothetical protein RI845_18310 [Colwelliaceae bacterium SQ345]
MTFFSTLLPVHLFSDFLHNIPDDKRTYFIDFYHWWKLNNTGTIDLKGQLLKVPFKAQSDYEKLIKRDFQESRTVSYKGLVLSETESIVLAALGYKLIAEI